MKEERIGVGDGLSLDLSIHIANGMTILTAEDVSKRPKGPFIIEWPKEAPFNPSGITLEEARAAVEKCK